MYTVSPNENLGMQVEQVRLAEIRQEIEARRVAGEVRDTRSNLANRPSGWLNQVTAWLAVERNFRAAKRARGISV